MQKVPFVFGSNAAFGSVPALGRMRRLVVLAGLLGLALAPVAQAGGSDALVRVKALSVDGTSYTLVVQPTTDAQNDPFMGGCPSFTVTGTYRYLNGALFKQPSILSREYHLAALAFLERAAQDQKVIRLGWMGTGFVAADSSNRCVVNSRALRILTGKHGMAVYSFHDAI